MAEAPRTTPAGDLPGKPYAVWLEGVEHPGFPPLAASRSADVAVIGGGIVGLMTALHLQQSGLTVVVLESRQVGRQVTGGSTAKATSLHRLIYADLIERYGVEPAKVYADANQWAIGRLEEVAKEVNAADAFARAPAYTFGQAANQTRAIEAEVEAARRLGLPADLVHETELPFSVTAAVRFANQGQIQPVRLMTAVADAIVARGGAVHEKTRVVSVNEGEPCRLRTATGIEVTAAHVVVATNLPFLDRGGFFAKCFPRRHVGMAARLDDDGAVPEGMYISTETPTRSVRGGRGADGKPVLVAIGDAFTTGHADVGAKFRDLEAWLREHFPVQAIDYHWGNQDYDSADGVPYIGRLTTFSRHAWTGTGFGAWGITNGTLAARIIADAICGRHNPWSGFFDATRLRPRQGGRPMLQRNLHVGREWVERRLKRPQGNPEDTEPGEGRVLQVRGQKLGVYRHPDGGLHAVSAVCTHMGCVLSWNGAEKSWDCPCHGSRFDVDGRVLHGPAVKDLAQPKLERD